MKKHNIFVKIIKYLLFFSIFFYIFSLSSCNTNFKIDFSTCSINYSTKNIYSYSTKVNQSGFIDEPIKVDGVNNDLFKFEIIMDNYESKPTWLVISDQNVVHWKKPAIESVLHFYVKATFKQDKTVYFITNEFVLYIYSESKIFVNIPTNSFKIASKTEGKSDFFYVTSNDDDLKLQNVSWSIIDLSTKISWLSISNHFGSNNVYLKWTNNCQPGIYTFKILANIGVLSAESEEITLNVIGDSPTPSKPDNIQLHYDGLYSFSLVVGCSGSIDHKLIPFFSDKTITIPNDLQYEITNFEGNATVIKNFSFDIEQQNFSCTLKWINIEIPGNYSFNIRCFSRSMNVSNNSQKFYFHISNSPIEPTNSILYSYDGNYIYNSTIGIDDSSKDMPFKVHFKDDQLSPEFITAEILMDDKPKWLKILSDSYDPEKRYQSWYFAWDSDSTPGTYSFNIKFSCNKKSSNIDPITTETIYLNIEKPNYIPFDKFYIINNTLFGFINEFNPNDYLYCNTLLIPKTVQWINIQTDSKEFKSLANSIPLSIQYLIFENDSKIEGIIDNDGPSQQKSSLSYVDFFEVYFPDSCQNKIPISFPPYFFKDWKCLENVKLPKNFNSSLKMFENCVKLKTVFNDYKDFGYDVLENNNLTTRQPSNKLGNKYCLNFGSGVIYEGMFENCVSLDKIFISDTAQISQNAFYGCTNLSRLNSDINGVFNFAKITPPNNKDFLISGFANNEKIKKIYFSGNYYTSILSMAFYKCKQLENIYSSNNIEEVATGFKDTRIKEIGKSSFAFCSKLSGSLEFPETIKWIGDYSFESTNYKSISLPSKMSLIIEDKKVVNSFCNYTIGEEFIKNDYFLQEIILDSWQLFNVYCKPGAPEDHDSISFYLNNLDMLETCFIDKYNFNHPEYPYSSEHNGWFGDIDKYVDRDGKIILINPINPDADDNGDDPAQFADTAHGLAQLATKKGGIKGYYTTDSGTDYYDPSNLFYWSVSIKNQY